MKTTLLGLALTALLGAAAAGAAPTYVTIDSGSVLAGSAIELSNDSGSWQLLGWDLVGSAVNGAPAFTAQGTPDNSDVPFADVVTGGDSAWLDFSVSNLNISGVYGSSVYVYLQNLDFTTPGSYVSTASNNMGVMEVVTLGADLNAGPGQEADTFGTGGVGFTVTGTAPDGFSTGASSGSSSGSSSGGSVVPEPALAGLLGVGLLGLASRRRRA